MMTDPHIERLRVELAAIATNPGLSHHSDAIRDPLLSRYRELMREIDEAERQQRGMKS